jgi:4-amino-4-deoxy-L-arabinose transferase-like glycosyltransferase
MKIYLGKIKETVIEHKILTLIILATFLASIGYSFHFRIEPAVDARAYDTIAYNLVQGLGYRENLTVDISQDNAIIRIGPLYEYFLAGIYKVFGHNYEAVWIIQAILRALSVWLIYLAARLVTQGMASSKNMALLSAVMFGFYPDLIEISAMLMTETLYLFLVCLVLYLFFRYLTRPTKYGHILLAIMLGLAIMARPPVILFAPIVMFYFYRKKAFSQLAVFLLFLGLVFVPWTLRNYNVYHEFMPFGGAGNFNFWIGNYHGGRGEQEPSQEMFSFALNHPIKEVNRESMRQFKDFIFQYPGEFIELTLLRTNKYFSFSRPIGFWFYQTGIGQVIVVLSSAIASVILFTLGLSGLWHALVRGRKESCYLAAFLLATPLLIIITVVETRYRFQIYPLLAIFAGYFLVVFYQEGKWRHNKIFWSVFAILCSNAVIDLMLSTDRLKEKLGKFF